MNRLKSISEVHRNEKYGYQLTIFYPSDTQVYKLYSNYRYRCLQELLDELLKSEYGYIYRKEGKQEMFKITEVQRVCFEIIEMEEEK